MTTTKFRVGLGVAASLILASNAFAGSVNLLINPSFEETPFAGAEQAGAGVGWTAFGGAFRIQGSPEPIGPAGAFDGTVVFKAFFGGGAFQDVAATAGDVVNAEVWIMSPSNADEVTGFAAVNLEFRDAGGALIGDILSNATFDDSAPEDMWLLQTISGVAPEGTASVRFALFADGGGAPRFDAASLQIETAVVPIPAAAWLMLSGVVGLMGLRRRKTA